MKYLLILLLLTFNTLAYDAFITPAELKNSLDDKNLVILDAGSSSSYSKGHISGALHVNISDFAKNKHIKSTADFTKIIQKELNELGINENSNVVIYSRNNNEEYFNSSYLAFILVQHGFENISILDGGYMAWVFEYNNMVSSKESYAKKESNYKLKYNPNFIAQNSHIKKNSQKITVIDGKKISEEEYAAITKKRDVIFYGSQIVFRHHRDNFLNDLTLKSDSELEGSFISKLDSDKDRELVVYDDTIFGASMNWYILYKKFSFKNTKIHEGSF